jgi:hypothetical protein
VFTSVCYGEAYDLQKFGYDPGYLKFTEANWNPYFYMSLLPFMGKAVRLYQKYRTMYQVIVVNGGKPPLPIFEVSEQTLFANTSFDSDVVDRCATCQGSARRRPQRSNHHRQQSSQAFPDTATGIPIEHGWRPYGELSC